MKIPRRFTRAGESPYAGIQFVPRTSGIVNPLEKIAERYTAEMPWTIRILLRMIGVGQRSGGILMSYLLSERKYLRALIELGYQDGINRRDEIMEFLGIKTVPVKDREMPQ